MEKHVKKLSLHEEKIAPLIEDPKLAMQTFWEILERGQALYPDQTDQPRPRTYKIIPLKGS